MGDAMGNDGTGDGGTGSGLRVTNTVFVPEAALHETFTAGTGPGGQHANKVATSVRLRVSLAVLPERMRERAAALAGSRLNAAGEIVVQANEHASQARNREAARARLLGLLKEAAAPPPRKRRPTRPTKGSIRRRLDGKTKRGATKRLRGRVTPD